MCRLIVTVLSRDGVRSVAFLSDMYSTQYRSNLVEFDRRFAGTKSAGSGDKAGESVEPDGVGQFIGQSVV